MNNDTAESPLPAPFIPNLCTLHAVFFLVLLGELLALSLSLVSSGLARMDWQDLGLRSFLIQWVVLASAALLCPLRPWLARSHRWLAGVASYALVLGVALVCLLGGEYLLRRSLPPLWTLADHLVLSAIFGGVVLRYLYIQQQLHNQQQAELRARIQALQSRIRPHFLFNSLNSIASLIDTAPAIAETMIEDLASLFRASLAEPGLTSLADELALCRQYLSIEQRRLGERLRVRWEVSDEALVKQTRLPIPSLLLQPLLENAVHHGIQPRPGGGEITVAITCLGDRLQVVIRNPLPSAGGAQSGNRMALDNIRYRLQAHFGSSAQFSAKVEHDQFVALLDYPALPLLPEP